VAVEFRILGDVEALSQGRRLDIGHARQRCVLACLLVDVNRPVSADQLIDRVWADNPPHRSRNALAAYVSRLRQLLADDADVELAHGPGGYTLTADPRSVDLHMFREMLSQARATADPADSAALFDRALDLWRGEPFSTLDAPWTNEVRTSLEAERLSAELDRNDAALEAGRHTDLLGGLAATLQAHPLDERVAGQLMLAQYRSGRQAVALETYRRLRNRLVDELGVDPGAKLRQVHEQILAGEDDQPIRVRSAPVVDRPANLRYVTRLLVRLGANDDGVALHHALLAAGEPSPLTAEQASSAPGPAGAGLTGTQAVALALSALRRFG
jgi:DNA-binding SARP family transcriptional activator